MQPFIICVSLTEMVELGVLVPYPEDGREAKDQRRPSVLYNKNKDKTEDKLHVWAQHQNQPHIKTQLQTWIFTMVQIEANLQSFNVCF